jgi:hypothetical protein
LRTIAMISDVAPLRNSTTMSGDCKLKTLQHGGQQILDEPLAHANAQPSAPLPAARPRGRVRVAPLAG